MIVIKKKLKENDHCIAHIGFFFSQADSNGVFVNRYKKRSARADTKSNESILIVYKRFSVVKVLFVSYFFEAVPLYKFNCEKISDQFFLYFFVFAKPFFIIIHSIDFDDSYTLENRTVNEKK